MAPQSTERSLSEKPVNVRFTVQEWLKVILAIVVVSVIQTWTASRYVASLESRIEATEKKNHEQDLAIDSTQEQLSNVKDRLAEALNKLASDVGEIKGSLNVLTRNRTEVK